MRKLIKKILKESDDLQWIRDVKTNDTIAKEIYDKLDWIKGPDVTTDYVASPWNKLVPFFTVRKRNLSDSILPIISPSLFHNGFKDYVRENYGIFYMSDIKEVYNKIKELMGDKIHRNINESDDLDWIKGNPISVGKCFTLYKSDGGIDAIVTIKEMEQREWKDNIYQKGGKFDPDNITIHLVGVNKNAKERVGSSFRISYNDLVENINDGDLAPTDCGNNINESDDLDWIRDVEPRLTKGLILCPNHERFIGGCKEVLKVDKVLGSKSLVYLKSLENGNRYANTIKDMMEWLSDGEYIINYQPLKESDDLDWIKDVPNIYIGMCLIKYNYGGGTNQYIVKEIDSEDVVTLEEINGWPDDEYDIDDLTDLIADGSFKPC